MRGYLQSPGGTLYLWSQSQRPLWVWVLGIQLQSSARISNAHKEWAISFNFSLGHGRQNHAGLRSILIPILILTWNTMPGQSLWLQPQTNGSLFQTAVCLGSGRCLNSARRTVHKKGWIHQFTIEHKHQLTFDSTNKQTKEATLRELIQPVIQHFLVSGFLNDLFIFNLCASVF